MSRETIEHLNTQTLIGNVAQRGKAWHWRAEADNHYDGPVPLADVQDRLFNWSAVQGVVSATALTDTGVLRAEAADRKAVMHGRTGEILGIHGSTYQIHQYNDWLIDNVSALLDADLQIGSAGVLQRGRKAWVQIELAETLEVKGEKLRPFLTAATAHDGSMATTYITGATRVVCDNTLAVALRGTDGEAFKVRHTTKSLSKIADARDALGVIHQVADDFTEQVNALTDQYVSDEAWATFVERFTATPGTTERSKNMAESKARELYQLWNYDERVAPWKNSAWGVTQAVNTHTQHFKKVRGVARDERNQLSLLGGGTRKEDQAALDLLASII
jgi:phage/plasmid-like protein (TIGR03299 family)